MSIYDPETKPFTDVIRFWKVCCKVRPEFAKLSFRNGQIGSIPILSAMNLKQINYINRRLENEARLRLFQQLHQSEEDDWRRASGRMLCEYCGLMYRLHPVEEVYNTDNRLCNGTLVHL